jgi:hypothetical protein
MAAGRLRGGVCSIGALGLKDQLELIDALF